MTQLHKCWARAQTGTLTLPGLFFCGEPGIGKSRLAVEAAELVKHCGGAVLELSGSPFHTQVGLHPVRVLLERRCGISRLTDAAERLGLLEAEVIARGLDPVTTVPLLAPVLAIGPEHGYEPTAAEGRRLEELIASAIQRYLLACFDSAAGLLVAEDLQWFDQSTLELVGSMLGAGGARLLVVLTGRDAGQLPEDCRVSRFDLVPLSNDQTDSLIRSLDATVRDDQCAEVRRRCDGVPFYIEQLVAGLRTPSSDTSGVPDALYEPLFARLRAGENVVPVVEAAAVIGRQIDRSLLLAVVDLGGAQLDEVIGQLERARVLERSITDTWQFRHELLREVAIELAPPSVRQKLHAKVADALSQNVSGDPEWPVVAGHYERAGQPADAASAYQRASTAARRRGALGEARTYLTHAVTQLEQCPPGPDRDRREIAPRLERGYLTATAEGAGSPVAAADFERCLQLAGTDLRDDDLVAALTGVTVYYIWRADLSRVSQLLKLVRTAAEQGRQWFHPAIDFTSGIVAWLRGEFDTARAYLDQTTTGPAEAYDHQIQTLRFVPNDPVATAHQYLAWDRLVHGDVAGAEAQLACAMDRADQLGYPQGPYNRLYTIDMEIWVRTEAGQYDRARALVAELIEKSNRYGLDYLYWRMLGATEQALVEGRASLASDNPGSTGLSAQIENLTQIVDVWRAVGANTNRPFYWCLLGRLLDAAGRPDQARARLDAALESTAETGVRFYSAELLRARAHTFNEPDARAAELAAARELARSQGVPLFELRTALDDFDLRGEPARGGLVDAVERMPANSPLPELAQALALLG